MRKNEMSWGWHSGLEGELLPIYLGCITNKVLE